MNGNGPLLFIPRTPVFSTTLGDISVISHVLYMRGKLLRQTLLAPVCETKGKPDGSQTGEWQGRGWGENCPKAVVWKNRRQKKRWKKKPLELCGTRIPLSEEVSVNLGLIHVKVCSLSHWEASSSSRVVKFKWKLSRVHEYTDVTLVKRMGRRCWRPDYLWFSSDVVWFLVHVENSAQCNL